MLLGEKGIKGDRGESSPVDKTALKGKPGDFGEVGFDGPDGEVGDFGPEGE